MENGKWRMKNAGALLPLAQAIRAAVSDRNSNQMCSAHLHYNSKFSIHKTALSRFASYIKSV
ncbi:hypothetical protein [Eubacterium sp.]|uniref:hypothetical protein n=1 Tax=Eubacterium sp. TaxID=142586 RepID=UPI0030DA7D40